MKKLLLYFLLVFNMATAQNGYWQQKVNYKMDVELNNQNHILNGTQQIIYYNNSPDTLYNIYYHLYWNAFQPGSSMDVRSRTIKDSDGRITDRISKLNSSETGYQKILQLKQDGKDVVFKVAETILEVKLGKPILPGKSTTFNCVFEAQVPVQIRRSGRNNIEGVDYSMSQWYPKICEYDKDGWHANPYIAREFYGVWGNFSVSLTIDSSYTVAATGTLANKKEIGKGYFDGTIKKQNNAKTKWMFNADNVHDFVWAADPNYLHDVRITKDKLELHFFYLNDTLITKNWKLFPEYAEQLFNLASEKFGRYQYPSYSIIQGGDGGMEYPMATLITGKRNLGSLVGVTVHEAMHSWYQMMLGFDESQYYWMDEGFTSYASTIIMEEIFPSKTPMVNIHIDAYKSYIDLAKSGEEEPLTTHADHFKTNKSYGISAYNKGEVFLKQLAYIIGEKNVGDGMKIFFNQWKFKHPTPDDLKKTMESISKIELDWYWDYFVNTTKKIDYSIQSIRSEKNNTMVTLERKGDFIMPTDVIIIYKNGKKELYNIPIDLMRGSKSEIDENTEYFSLSPWNWTFPVYSFEVKSTPDLIDRIEIDPYLKTADIELENNVIELKNSENYFYKR
jgi:Peptidase family M1 domain